MYNFQLESKFASINESINKLRFLCGCILPKYTIFFSFLSVLRFSNFLKGIGFSIKKILLFLKKYLIANFS